MRAPTVQAVTGALRRAGLKSRRYMPARKGRPAQWRPGYQAWIPTIGVVGVLAGAEDGATERVAAALVAAGFAVRQSATMARDALIVYYPEDQT